MNKERPTIGEGVKDVGWWEVAKETHIKLTEKTKRHWRIYIQDLLYPPHTLAP